MAFVASNKNLLIKIPLANSKRPHKFLGHLKFVTEKQGLLL